jgi:hypothetical protein
MLPNPLPYFQDLKDPRRETQNKLHKLSDIVMIVLCAVLSGIEDWVGMEEFAKEKESGLRGFLELPNGIPSHDTLSDVLGRIDAKAFQGAFLHYSGCKRGCRVCRTNKSVWMARRCEVVVAVTRPSIY